MTTVNTAVTAYKSKSFHTHWSDVNPLRMQTKDYERQYSEYRAFDNEYRKQSVLLLKRRVLYSV